MYYRCISRDWSRLVCLLLFAITFNDLDNIWRSALEFAKHGASGLVLHYFETDEEILSLKAEIETYNTRVVTVYGDISDPATSTKVGGSYQQSLLLNILYQIVQSGVDTFGRIDVLVSNAGICPFHEFLSMPLEIYERTRQVNLDGSFYIVQGNLNKYTHSIICLTSMTAVANQMKNQTPQGGAIVAISSISAFFGGEFQWYLLQKNCRNCILMQFQPLYANESRNIVPHAELRHSARQV